MKCSRLSLYTVILILLFGVYLFVLNNSQASPSSKHVYKKGAKLKQSTTSKKSKSIAYSNTIYLRTAIVIDLPKGGIGVRITTLQECGNKRQTTMRIGDLQMKLSKTTIHKSCPWAFAPRCHLVGYFATGTMSSNGNQTVPLPPQLPEFAQVYDDKRDVWKRLDLVDGRSTPSKPHRLAVCLQPIYLMADWRLLPQFFETWIGNGATIFYIYVHSISEEVDLMIKLYEAQRDIEVVRVNWPTVPTVAKDDDDLNPNNRMYRTEVGAAVNDCILRSRATAELAVSSDLDEIIAPLNRNGETLFDIIEDYRNRTLKNSALPGAFLFKHSFAYVENNWFSISHPSQLSFQNYSTVDYEKKVWQRGYRSKVIYVPDRVFRAHVHDTVNFESKQWATAVVDPIRARVLHFRQVVSKAMQTSKVIAGTDVLREAALKWQDSYAARVEAAVESDLLLQGAFNLTLSTPVWPNLGEKVLKEIETCRVDNDKMKKDKCVTEQRCRSTMRTIRPDQWIEPDSDEAWTII
ncbi:hypothetical protein PRIPAC_81621 [Pristionchus pacificus]|nr:hypothetical protein PRIPAC_81621 [Pristionchus pacificus]